MQKQKNYQLAIIAVLAFAVLFMSVGFAAYAQTLNIQGTTTVAGNKWSVHFDTSTYQLGEGSVAETSKSISDTTVEYTASLAKPGDYYLFSIDVVNDGTFDAVLNKITMSTLDASQAKYLSYVVTYDGTPYSASADSLNLSLPTTSGANRKNVKVKVTYNQPASAADLPATAVNVTLSASLDYAQAN